MPPKKTTIQALASAAAALAAAAASLAEECGGECPNPGIVTEPTPATTQALAEAKKGRGRPATPPAEEEPKAEKPAFPTFADLRLLIKPLVEGGQGGDVKKIINKYAPCLQEITDDKKAAFVKDIEALSY